MRKSGGRKSKPAEELESEMEDREQNRREQERHNQRDLMQNVQVGAHDSQRLGVHWPPSYKSRKKHSKSSSKRRK